MIWFNYPYKSGLYVVYNNLIDLSWIVKGYISFEYKINQNRIRHSIHVNYIRNQSE